MSIYVVLSKTNTRMGGLIRFFLNSKYNHASICTDINFQELYTFARVFYNLPIVGGFIKEDIYCMFSKKDSLDIRILKIPVDKDQFLQITNILREIELDSEKYTYNLLSILSVAFNINIKVHKSFNCSQFIAKLLEDYNITKLNKPHYKYTPKDLDILLSDYWYSDKTILKNNYTIKNVEYFKDFGFITATKITINSIIDNFKRIQLKNRLRIINRS